MADLVNFSSSNQDLLGFSGLADDNCCWGDLGKTITKLFCGTIARLALGGFLFSTKGSL